MKKFNFFEKSKLVIKQLRTIKGGDDGTTPGIDEDIDRGGGRPTTPPTNG